MCSTATASMPCVIQSGVCGAKNPGPCGCGPNRRQCKGGLTRAGEPAIDPLLACIIIRLLRGFVGGFFLGARLCDCLVGGIDLILRRAVAFELIA
jgi:hypothetical protein